jgi:putative FmdB family regulatory protein
MPIYEFYCADCHTIYSFLSRSINTRKRPRCPQCGRERLERRVSPFAISSGAKETEDDPALPGMDDDRMERAMAGLADEIERTGDEDDPRALAGLMHKFFDATGLPMGDGMQEALRRLQAGEDPESIEEEMGDLLNEEDPFAFETLRRPGVAARRMRPPAVDKTLYEL